LGGNYVYERYYEKANRISVLYWNIFVKEKKVVLDLLCKDR